MSEDGVSNKVKMWLVDIHPFQCKYSACRDILLTSCWNSIISQLVNKLATNLLPKILLTSCWNSIISQLVNMFATNLLRKILLTCCWNSIVTTCYITSLLQTCFQKSCWQVVGTALYHNLLTCLLQTCWGDILLTSCWNSIISQLVNRVATSLLKWHLVDKLLEQHCHNLLTSLPQTCWQKSCWQVVGTALYHNLSC
jgi:hypothetical protein